jgi:hypothetical protein
VCVLPISTVRFIDPSVRLKGPAVKWNILRVFIGLASHFDLLDEAVQVCPIQQKSFPDINMWNCPVPNQPADRPSGAGQI